MLWILWPNPRSDEMVLKRWIPSRYRIGFLGMTACSLLYTLRVNINVAIIAMVKPKNSLHPKDWCYEYNSSADQPDDYPSDRIYEWSESTQGIILGAYFYGFTATQVIGGLLTDRWGAKWVCLAGLSVPGLVNAFTPFAADEHFGWLIVIRVIIGTFHGLVNSSLFSMYAKWFPTSERTIAIAATQLGGNIGAMFMAPMSGYLAKHGYAGGWPSVFYTSSAIHIVWIISWLFFAYDSPADCKNIDPDEHLYILQNTDSQTNKSSDPIPWRSILTSRAVYGSIFAKTSGTFGYYVLTTSVPLYFDTIFALRIIDNGVYTALMYLFIGITLMSAGPLSTFIIAKSNFSRTRIRKVFQMICTTCRAGYMSADCAVRRMRFSGCRGISGVEYVFVWLHNGRRVSNYTGIRARIHGHCVWHNHDLVAVVVLVVLSMCLYGFITGGEYPIIPEYAPEFTGTVFGITNTLASSMGFLAPIIVGQILDTEHNSETRKKWDIVFYVTAAFYLLGALFFEIFGSAERQPWARVTINRSPDIELNQMSANGANGRTKNGSQNETHFSRNRIFSRFKKSLDTESPEWVEFKKNTYIK
ncbi:unnamed protein product [Medioppia subpectinata]|uniref:Major facilitator superfamily (MFS) profile domain-containing protein n=1 Tax=Medioppia subpectinata TaxID=1979941 RepID=A0A7R9KVU5_9ACAR|nr:unnamed protein product [Medioppia subpectinata]CAG2110653.1 unnamed protein product [Medioppia subpectinata]